MTPAHPPTRTTSQPAPSRPARTFAVTARSSSRFARLKLRYPDAAPLRRYDADQALELLANTADLPARKHDLIVIMTEYRHALHALATQAAPAEQRRSASEIDT